MSPLYTHIRESGGTGAITIQLVPSHAFFFGVCVCAFVPLAYYLSPTRPPAIQMSWSWVQWQTYSCLMGKTQVQTKQIYELWAKTCSQHWLN